MAQASHTHKVENAVITSFMIKTADDPVESSIPAPISPSVDNDTTMVVPELTSSRV